MPLRLCFRFLIAAAALSLAACGYIPRAVEGVPAGAPWEALPLRKWLAEDRAEPEALAFCAAPECRPGLVVGVMHLRGKDAAAAAAVLRNPGLLAQALRSRPARTASARTTVAVEPLGESPYSGFAISLAPAGGGKA